MKTGKPTKTIDQVFEEFLADQKVRLSPTTYRRYNDILDLFRSCLEGYWPGHDQEEYNRITDAGGNYCGTFGPEEIAGGLSEFLGYFMPHKVIAGKETMKAAGTVTKKLMKWSAEKGYVDDTEALEMAEERAGKAAHDLPAARAAMRESSARLPRNLKNYIYLLAGSLPAFIRRRIFARGRRVHRPGAEMSSP